VNKISSRFPINENLTYVFCIAPAAGNRVASERGNASFKRDTRYKLQKRRCRQR